MSRFLISVLALGLLAGASCSADGGGNEAPQIVLTVGNELTLEVGDTLQIGITANDPEGTCNSFAFEARPADMFSLSSAKLLDDKCNQASFEWAPIASDVTQDEPMRLIFIVTDGAGQVTEKTVNVTIVPGNGKPRFLNNQSELYDPRSGDSVDIQVLVRDDDSNEVELRIDDGPTGSVFEQIGNFEGSFTWKPSVEQLKKRVHSVTFIADDGQNAEEVYVVTIVIRTNSGGELKPDATNLTCPGEAVIDHQPLGVMRVPSDYEVTASLSASAAARYDKLFLYMTVGDPYSDVNDEGREDFESIELKDDGSGTFRATIANQASIIPEGDAITISYTICAIDEDSSDDTSVICVPSAGDFNLYYNFAAYLPDEEAVCIDDGVDESGFGDGNDTFEAASVVSSTSFGFFRTCDGNDDYHALQVRPGESYLLAAIYSDGQTVDIEAFDDSRSSLTLSKSSCTGLQGIEVSVPENGSTSNFYLKVSGGDGLSYQVRAVKVQGGAGGCIDDAMEPNDTAIDATLAGDGESISAEICTADDVDIFAIELNSGDEITFVHAFSNSQGNLDLTLFLPSQADIVSKDNINSSNVYTAGFVDEETLVYTAVESGTHYLLVFNNNETANAYSLNISIDKAPACDDSDQFSSAGPGNHTQDDAPILASSDFLELTGLAVCPGKPDWYQRTEFNLNTVLGELRVTGGGTLGDVTLEAYDIGGTVIATGADQGSYKDFDYTPTSTGPIFIKISSTLRTTYELDLLR